MDDQLTGLITKGGAGTVLTVLIVVVWQMRKAMEELRSHITELTKAFTSTQSVVQTSFAEHTKAEVGALHALTESMTGRMAALDSKVDTVIDMFTPRPQQQPLPPPYAYHYSERDDGAPMKITDFEDTPVDSPEGRRRTPAHGLPPLGRSAGGTAAPQKPQRPKGYYGPKKPNRGDDE